MDNSFDNIRLKLIEATNLIINEIYSLSETEQDEIFNFDTIPSNDYLKFLKNAYYSLTELVGKSNHVE